MSANPYGYADVTAVTDKCPFTEEDGGKELPQLAPIDRRAAVPSSWASQVSSPSSATPTGRGT